jgi:hypothetical protein
MAAGLPGIPHRAAECLERHLIKRRLTCVEQNHCRSPFCVLPFSVRVHVQVRGARGSVRPTGLSCTPQPGTRTIED